MMLLPSLREETAAVLTDTELADVAGRVARVHRALTEARVATAKADVLLYQKPDDSSDWERLNGWAGHARLIVLERQTDGECLHVELKRHAHDA